MAEIHVHGPHNSYFSRPYHKNLPINSVYHTILTREFISTHHGVHHTRLLTNMKKSEHFIEKLSPWKVLRGHRGCVNSVLFSDNGEFIYTGSDDTRINIYTTHSGELISTIPTIHTQNIFYAKDFPQQSNMVDYLLSCGADGKVILTNIQRSQSLPRNSNSTQTRIGSGKLLYRHQGRSHRISMIPGEPYQFLTCGEDGMCCLFDLRDKMQNLFGNYDNLPVQEELQSQLERNQLPVLKIQFRPRLLSANMSNVSRDLQDRAPLQSAYCIGVNPFHPYEVAVGGTHTKVALFDIRNHQKAFGYLCPEHMLDSHTAHVTGLKYSYNGQHLIASYNDDDVYSFHIQRHTRLLQDDESRAANGAGLWNSACNAMSSLFSRFRRPPLSSNDSSVPVVNCFDPEDAELDGDGDEEPQGFYRRYRGHRNSDTVKQVAFMGNQSEWVISGSDCGHIFIWNTHTSKLTKVLYGDKVGAVNCLASHPHLPLLATSGLENNAKLWYPLSDATSLEKDEKEKEKVDNIIQSNQERQRAFPVSSRVLRRIIRLLSQSAFAEAEDGEEEEEEEGTMTSGTRRSSEEIDDGEGQQRRRRRRISLNEVNALLPLLSVAFGYGGPSSDEDEDDDRDEDEEEEDEENDEEEMEQEEHAVRRSRRSDGSDGSEEEDEEGSDEEEEDEYESGFEEGAEEVNLEKDEDEDEDDDEDEDEDDEMEDDEGIEVDNIDGDTTKDLFEDSDGDDNSNKSSEKIFLKRSSPRKLSENQFQEEAAIDVLETNTERDLLIKEDEQIV